MKPCCIGDLVMALPAIDALAALTPEGKVDIAVGPHSRAIIDSRQNINEVLPIGDTPKTRDALRLAGHVQSFDSVALLDRSRLLHLATRFSRNVTTARDVDQHDRRHEADVYLEVARRIGARPQTTIPSIEFSSETRSEASTLLEHLPSRYIAIHPGGAQNPGSEMVDKRWPTESYAEVIRWAMNRDLGVVATGGPGDAQLVDRLKALLNDDREFVSIAGQASLMASAFVASRSRLFVGADTGMSHLVAASGAPAIVIFGPTNPNRYAPRGPRVRVLAPPESYELRDRDLRKTSAVVDPPATASVTVGEVIEAAEALLSRSETPCRAN